MLRRHKQQIREVIEELLTILLAVIFVGTVIVLVYLFVTYVPTYKARVDR